MQGLVLGKHTIHIGGRKREGKEGGREERRKGGKEEDKKVEPWCSSEISQKTEVLVGETSSSGSSQRAPETLQVTRHPRFFYIPGHPGLKFKLKPTKTFSTVIVEGNLP